MRPASWAVVDQEALKHNLQQVRLQVSQSKIMAVIKANGYGHGLSLVAGALKGEGVDAFAVARVDEAIELREAGISQRIVVLEGFYNRDELQLHCQYQLEPVIHTLEQIIILENDGSADSHLWLKLDTGMHRLGIEVENFRSCYERLRKRFMVSIMTHLANADDQDDPMTLRQLNLFNEQVSGYSSERSIANSAGIIGWKQSHAEWVRPGIMLYGVSPFVEKAGFELGLKPVMSLYSRLISIKTVLAGERIGYGGSYTCQRKSRIGVIAIGYGDGYPRQVLSDTPVLINGERVFLVGRVSMDMITVDLTDHPAIKVGDSALLWGAGLPVESIAKKAGTISYTLLCGVTQRVKFVKNQL